MVEWNAIVGLVGDLGAMGFILWLTQRLTSHTIPRLASGFADASKQQRDDFREALSQQRSDLQRWQELAHSQHEKEIGQLVEARGLDGGKFGSVYHLNGIQSWAIDSDGSVSNVHHFA